MVRIGVTGGVACGKSLAGSFLVELGVPVLDTDTVAHRVMARGTRAHQEVIRTFGRAVVGDAEEIDRRHLAAVVFSDADRRADLNRIVHPYVREACVEWLRDQPPHRGAAAVVVPLLFEVAADWGWDATVCVGCSAALQRERLHARGLSEAEMKMRLGSQMPVLDKMRSADYTLYNEGAGSLLKRQLERVMTHILEY